MTKYAQIVKSIVHGVYEYDPLPEFAPNIVMIELPEDSPVQAGWLYENGEFIEPPMPPIPQPSPDAVDVERDRRINEGFEFQGVLYQSRLPKDGKSGDWEVFSGKALEALIAQLSGAQPGDLRWSDPDEDFAWIAADNSRVPMDAQTVIELAKAASSHRTRHTFAGSDLKAMDPIPADYTDDKYWP